MAVRYTVAIDIGGTNTAFALVDEQGKILKKNSIPTVGFANFGEYSAALFGEIRKLAGAIPFSATNGGEPNADSAIVGIGIGAPCANPETGEIEGATDLPWPSPIPLKRLFEEEFGVPVKVANDAKCAAIGEMVYGRAKGLRNFIMLTLGTGVGSGIVCDGHLISGSRGFGGELGHVTVKRDRRRLCGCGRYDCLQNYCSATGVVATAHELLEESSEDSLLRHCDTKLTAKYIAECAEKGDSLSRRVFEETGKVLGQAVANFAAFTDPEAIIFFGGVANALPLMRRAIEEEMERNLLFLYKGRIKILKSELNDAEAALLGASALVRV